jgi:hypothetical protein
VGRRMRGGGEEGCAGVVARRQRRTLTALRVAAGRGLRRESCVWVVARAAPRPRAAPAARVAQAGAWRARVQARACARWGRRGEGGSGGTKTRTGVRARGECRHRARAVRALLGHGARPRLPAATRDARRASVGPAGRARRAARRVSGAHRRARAPAKTRGTQQNPQRARGARANNPGACARRVRRLTRSGAPERHARAAGQRAAAGERAAARDRAQKGKGQQAGREVGGRLARVRAGRRAEAPPARCVRATGTRRRGGAAPGGRTRRRRALPCPVTLPADVRAAPARRPTPNAPWPRVAARNRLLASAWARKRAWQRRRRGTRRSNSRSLLSQCFLLRPVVVPRVSGFLRAAPCRARAVRVREARGGAVAPARRAAREAAARGPRRRPRRAGGRRPASRLMGPRTAGRAPSPGFGAKKRSARVVNDQPREQTRGGRAACAACAHAAARLCAQGEAQRSCCVLPVACARTHLLAKNSVCVLLQVTSSADKHAHSIASAVHPRVKAKSEETEGQEAEETASKKRRAYTNGRATQHACSLARSLARCRAASWRPLPRVVLPLRRRRRRRKERKARVSRDGEKSGDGGRKRRLRRALLLPRRVHTSEPAAGRRRATAAP